MSSSWLVRVLPFAFYIVIMAFSGTLQGLGWDVRWMYGVRVGGTLLLLAFLWRHYSELIDAQMLSQGQTVLAVLAGLVVFVLWINLDRGWMVIGVAHGYAPLNTHGEIDWFMAIMRLAGAAMVVPVMEEVFWRSFLMRWIDRQVFLEMSPKLVSYRAVLGSSLLFAFEHTLLLAGLIAGLVFAGLYVRTANLWAPVIAHVVANATLGAWVIATGQWSFW